jgi:hypothetical protein
MPREGNGTAQGPHSPVKRNCSGPGVHLARGRLGWGARTGGLRPGSAPLRWSGVRRSQRSPRRQAWWEARDTRQKEVLSIARKSVKALLQV